MNPRDAISKVLTPGDMFNQRGHVWRSVRTLAQFASCDFADVLDILDEDFQGLVTVKPNTKHPAHGPLVALSAQVELHEAQDVAVAEIGEVLAVARPEREDDEQDVGENAEEEADPEPPGEASLRVPPIDPFLVPEPLRPGAEPVYHNVIVDLEGGGHGNVAVPVNAEVEAVVAEPGMAVVMAPDGAVRILGQPGPDPEPLIEFDVPGRNYAELLENEGLEDLNAGRPGGIGEDE